MPEVPGGVSLSVTGSPPRGPFSLHSFVGGNTYALTLMRYFGPDLNATAPGTAFDAALQRLTKRIGAASKYNAMITWLFLMLIAERVRADEDWPSFRARNADLFDQGPWSRAA